MLNNFGEVSKNVDLTNYNTYGIHTTSKYLIKPNSKDKLKKLLEYLKQNKINYFVLGGGSNVILPDTQFNGVIISLEYLNNIKIEGTIINVEAGISLSKLVAKSINDSLGGLEHLASIPGTLGGALYGNAGANGSSIYDYLESITILRDNEFIELYKEDILYSYRNTMFKGTSDIIVMAKFKLYKDDQNKLKEIIKENRIKRKNTQPLEYKNAGSVFKNPKNDYAGRLIDEVGLKGYWINDAKISEKHANFIVNLGNATSKDIKDLINMVKEKVYKEYNIELELEQNIIEWE